MTLQHLHGLGGFEEPDEAVDQQTQEPAPVVRAAEEPKRATAAILVDIALERYEFGCTPDGESFAIPMPAGHVVRMFRGSRSTVRAELAREYRDRTGKIAGQQALADAMLVLEGQAQDTEPQRAHLRVAEHRGVIWIDLGDVDEHAIRLDASGWVVVDRDVPVLFKRTNLTEQIPVPTRGGRLDELWELLNVTGDDRPLVLAWLVAALACPGIPHPVLALFGEQGTGKSTASRTLVNLVEPSPVPLRKPPRDSDGWVTAAAGSWVVGLDNLSTVSDWLSDTLCRAVTGDGDVRRKLYTDGELTVYSFRRAVVLNGIDLAGMRGDLAERLMTVNLARIDEQHRLTERQITDRWEQAHPRIIGALLDQAASMLRALPSVELPRRPRMADFALVLAGLDAVNNTDGLTRYASQAAKLATDTLTADPFIAAMMGTLDEPFEGSASELHELVTSARAEERTPRDWPKSGRAVTSSLKRNAPALRKDGWTVDDLGADNHQHATIWRITPAPVAPEMTGIPSSPRSQTRAGEPGREPASEASNQYGPSQVVCTVCGRPLPASAIKDGFRTHPECDPD